jgi:hypothetical protein
MCLYFSFKSYFLYKIRNMYFSFKSYFLYKIRNMSCLAFGGCAIYKVEYL